MAGIFRLDYGTFLRFNTPAVIIGISEFIIIGYFFGNHIGTILSMLHRYGLALGLILLGLAILVLIVRRYFDWRSSLDRTEAEATLFISQHFGWSLLVIAGVIIGVLYLIRPL